MRAAMCCPAIGSFDPPTTPLDADGQGIPYACYGFAAQMAEVTVDVALGLVKVVRMVAAHDVGRAINPTLVEGQIHGGIAQGLGLALMEEYLPGRTENLHDYLIPTFGDMPEIKTILIEDAAPFGPFGAKGIGEPALIPTAPAIFAAIENATGVRITRAPATPDRVHAALKRAGVQAMTDMTETFGAREGDGIVRCDACPVLCRIRPGKSGACDRYANVEGNLVRVDPVVLLQKSDHAVAFMGAEWSGNPLRPDDVFVTGIGAGTTYPDYKPAPFIVSSKVDGVDMITVVTEGIFSYCGVKVKIDTDRYIGPEQAAVRAAGEQVGHVTTAEYGSQMLAIGGVRHLTGGSKKEGTVTCDTMLALVQWRGSDAQRRWRLGSRRQGDRRAGDRRHRRKRACGSAAARRRSACSPSNGNRMSMKSSSSMITSPVC